MAWPDFHPPTLLARVGPRLPQKPWSQALAISLNTARRLGKLPEDIGFLAGRSVSVRVRDLGATATVLMQQNGLFVAASGSADVRFSANLSDFVSIIRRQEDPDTLFFQRRLLIEGDTELGLTLKNLLDSVELPGWLRG